MQAPAIFKDGEFEPFPATPLGSDDLADDIFFATDRQPSDDLSAWPWYLDERGHVLRLGTARVEVADEALLGEDLDSKLLLQERGREYPIRVENVNELGIFDRSYDALIQFSPPEQVTSEPRKEFVRLVNERLARSTDKSIYLYTHGYKMQFDNPVLVSSELWHFLGYQGVFIAYSWPSTPSRWAYSKDLETTAYTARHLRQFLQFLAEETDARQINILGYSAGTRVVIKALTDMAMLQHGDSREQLLERNRIGQLLLVSSDFDRDVFVGSILDGMLDIPERVTIYLSSTDQALGASRFLLSNRRLGEIMADESLSEQEAGQLNPRQNLYFVDVTAAEKTDTGNGHNYFRQSPWVSSDILSTLRYQLSPEERGLVREPGSAIWVFPEDYPGRLQQAIEATLPAE